MSESEQCTCGSGGHPRHCRAHPLAFEAHCLSLDAYAQIPDCSASETDAYEATLAAWVEAERADARQRVEAAAPRPMMPGERAALRRMIDVCNCDATACPTCRDQTVLFEYLEGGGHD